MQNDYFNEFLEKIHELSTHQVKKTQEKLAEHLKRIKLRASLKPGQKILIQDYSQTRNYNGKVVTIEKVHYPLMTVILMGARISMNADKLKFEVAK